MSTNRLLRLPDVIFRVRLSRSKIYAMVKEDMFPAPVKIGKASLWDEAEVSRWIEGRVSNG